VTILDDDDDPFVDAPDDDEYDESYGEPDTVDTGVYWRNYFTKALNVTRPADEVLGPYREGNTMPTLKLNDGVDDVDNRRMKDLKRQIATAEAHRRQEREAMNAAMDEDDVTMIDEYERQVKVVEGYIKRNERDLVDLRDRIEAIKNRPEDTYPNGTYIIVEKNRPEETYPYPMVNVYTKQRSKWLINGWPTSWRQVSTHMATATTWRVVEMHEE